MLQKKDPLNDADFLPASESVSVSSLNLFQFRRRYISLSIGALNKLNPNPVEVPYGAVLINSLPPTE